MKIGVLGSGIVGRTLAGGFLKHGYETMLGTREEGPLAEWKSANPGGRIGSVSEAAAFGDAIVLAVKGLVAADVLRSAGSLSGKTVLDATNPVADAPPVNGVLRFFTNLDESLMERLQREFATANFVKAFSSVGNAHFVNPKFAQRPTMFICGNHAPSKEWTAQVLDQFGWETADMGGVEAARAIEPLCILWCIPVFLRNESGHAFKVVRN